MRTAQNYSTPDSRALYINKEFLIK